MSQAQLLEIENNLLNTLNLEDLEILVSDLYQKIKEQKIKKKNILPPHIRKGIKESLAEIKNGNFVDTLPDEDVSIVKSIQKIKKNNHVHAA